MTSTSMVTILSRRPSTNLWSVCGTDKAIDNGNLTKLEKLVSPRANICSGKSRDFAFLCHHILYMMVPNILADDCNNCDHTVKQAYWNFLGYFVYNEIQR